jgi:hypothetical protein
MLFEDLWTDFEPLLRFKSRMEYWCHLMSHESGVLNPDMNKEYQ